MPTFDGYDADYVDAIETGSYGKSDIYKGTWYGSPDHIILAPIGGGYEGIGPLTGPEGPVGQTGTATQTDVDTVAAKVEWSPWINLTLTSDWERWSTDFAPPRARYNQYSVQLSGLLRYVGPTITSGYAILVSSLPSALIPAYNQAASVEISGSYQSDFRVYHSTSPPRMHISLYTNGPDLIQNNSHINLDGITYALD